MTEEELISTFLDLFKENEQLKKQEKILLDRILTLQKTNGSLTDKIEKMKCCGNCKHYNYCPMQTNREC